jgi:hypothetical protein
LLIAPMALLTNIKVYSAPPRLCGSSFKSF